MSEFISYTTVFRSRLGATNLVTSHCTTGFSPEEALLRKVRADIGRRVLVDLEDPGSSHILEYLLMKGLVGSSIRKSARYRVSLAKENDAWIARDSRGARQRQIEVAVVDVAMADPRVPSTIGTPTPDNAGELLDLTYQLGLVSRTKRNLTAAGQAVMSLRDFRTATNPFLVEDEAVLFMRQLVASDGLMLKHFVAAIDELESPLQRSKIATDVFPAVVARMYEEVAGGGYRVDTRREVKAFRDHITATAHKATGGSRGPGVLEHRTSPRLEWLCDLRVLRKEGLASNAFSYLSSDDLHTLRRCLWDEPGLASGADEVAVAWWRQSIGFRNERIERSTLDVREALIQGYRLIRRPGGPSAIRDVALLGAIVARDNPAVGEMATALVEWSQEESRISLSGGRYKREPELVQIRKELVE